MPAPASRRPRFKSARAYVISLHTMLFRVNESHADSRTSEWCVSERGVRTRAASGENLVVPKYKISTS